MKLHRWSDVRRKAFTPEQIEKQDRKIEKELEALGGELEVVARFGDKAVKLRGV